MALSLGNAHIARLLACALALAACSDALPTTVEVDEVVSPPAEPAAADELSDARLWSDPASPALRQADTWRTSRPGDAELMARLGAQPQADWFGDWTPDVRGAVAERVALAAQGGALPVLVAYNLPGRDCGSHSAGGAQDDAGYRAWIRAFADGLGGRAALVVLEPDGLALLDCLSESARAARLALLRGAIETLREAGALVYLDAGHPRWHAPQEMADRLREAGVVRARGFALNVSNFVGDAENLAYGKTIAAKLEGMPFVIDTGRNGLGPAPEGAWCNPEGRALGRAPTLRTGDPAVDAFLWIKRPGESDGACGGGPPAGTWWPEYALGLAKRASAF